MSNYLRFREQNAEHFLVVVFLDAGHYMEESFPVTSEIRVAETTAGSEVMQRLPANITLDGTEDIKHYAVEQQTAATLRRDQARASSSVVEGIPTLMVGERYVCAMVDEHLDDENLQYGRVAWSRDVIFKECMEQEKINPEILRNSTVLAVRQ